jgi:hypothetical protein
MTMTRIKAHISTKLDNDNSDDDPNNGNSFVLFTRHQSLTISHCSRTCPSAGLFLAHHFVMARSTSARTGAFRTRVRAKPRIMVIFMDVGSISKDDNKTTTTNNKIRQ